MSSAIESLCHKLHGGLSFLLKDVATQPTLAFAVTRRIATRCWGLALPGCSGDAVDAGAGCGLERTRNGLLRWKNVHGTGSSSQQANRKAEQRRWCSYGLRAFAHWVGDELWDVLLPRTGTVYGYWNDFCASRNSPSHRAFHGRIFRSPAGCKTS
jgi:hypothetical protein